MEPGDWAMLEALVKAANEIPVPGEGEPLPAGLSDLGPNTQVALQSLPHLC